MLYIDDGIYIVGLTGMSGAGKTTACRVFSEFGFAVIDCDITARRVVEPGRPALAAIAERFGKGVLAADGTLDRRKLGDIVFAGTSEREALNDIIYPFITYEILKEAELDSAEGERLLLLDAPTLFESGADRLCDTVVCVTADKGSCTKRIMSRDGITELQACNRLSSQHDAEFYTSRSQYCAENTGSFEEFGNTLRSIAAQVKTDAYTAMQGERV